MDAFWVTRANMTCRDWTSSSEADKQAVGWACAKDNGLMHGGVLECNSNNFICVSP
jgi:hypothetical protein